MQYKSNKGFSGLGQIGILILFVGVGMILAGMTQFIIGFKIIPAETPFEKMGEAMIKSLEDPKNVNISRWLQFLSTLMMFCIPAIMYSLVCNGKQLLWLGFSKHINIIQIFFGFLIIFTANIASGTLQDLSEMICRHFPSVDAYAARLENMYNEQVMALSHIEGIPDLILSLVIMAFLPAMFEELFFRGALQQILIRWWKKPIIAIIITSLIFSLIHMSVYLFLSRAVLGFVLGLMFYKTKNIWVNIVAHFLNNAIAVFQVYALTMSKQKIDVSKMDIKVDWWFGIIGAVALYYLFVYLRKYSEENSMKIYSKEQSLMKNDLFV